MKVFYVDLFKAIQGAIKAAEADGKTIDYIEVTQAEAKRMKADDPMWRCLGDPGCEQVFWGVRFRVLGDPVVPRGLQEGYQEAIEQAKREAAQDIRRKLQNQS